MKKQRLIIESIRYITGNQKAVKIQGTQKQVEIYRRALNASKKLYESLQLKSVSLKEVESLVESKNKWANAWKSETGESWPF